MKRYFSDAELEQFFREKFRRQSAAFIHQKIFADPRNIDFLQTLAEKQKLEALEGSAESSLSGVGMDILAKRVAGLVLKRPEVQKKLPGLAAQIDPARRQLRQETFSIGDIYETALPLNWPYPHQERRLVVLLSDTEGAFDSDNPDVTVAPITYQSRFASSEDLILASKESDLKTQVAIRFSDIQPVFVSQLSAYLGRIQDSLIPVVKEFWKQALGIENKAASFLKPAQKRQEGEKISHRRFYEQEHAITAYLRVPVQQMLRIANELPDVLGIDLSFRLNRETVLRSEQFPAATAAAAAPMHLESLFYGADRVIPLVLQDHLEILLIVVDGLQLKLITDRDIRDLHLSIREGETPLLYRKLSLEKNLPQYISLEPLPTFLNKILEMSAETDGDKVHQKFRFYHGYV